MKLLLLIVFFFSLLQATAQGYRPLDVTPSHPLYRPQSSSMRLLKPDADSLARKMKKQLAQTGEEQGVIRLPQDQMPCIIPAEPAEATIPNAWRKKKGMPGG